MDTSSEALTHASILIGKRNAARRFAAMSLSAVDSVYLIQAKGQPIIPRVAEMANSDMPNALYSSKSRSCDRKGLSWCKGGGYWAPWQTRQLGDPYAINQTVDAYRARIPTPSSGGMQLN